MGKDFHEVGWNRVVLGGVKLDGVGRGGLCWLIVGWGIVRWGRKVR